jgi:hypothetical protein
MLNDVVGANQVWRAAMAFSRMRRLSAVLPFAIGAAYLSGVPANAACFPPSQQLSPAALAQFTASPADVLKLSNAVLITKVRDLVASSPAALQTILRLLSGTNPQQTNAIGTGLGQAALICVRTDQAFATEIQNAVAGNGNSQLTLAFAAVLGDKPIGGLGGGVAGGGGGGGGSPGAGGGQTNPITGSGTGGSFGSSPAFTSFSTKNTGTNFFTSSSAGAPGAPSSGGTTFISSGGTTFTTTTTTTITNVVSPTR